MSSRTTECYCGKGSITHVTEMDDWNRSRSSTLIHCPDCLKKAADEAEERRQEATRNKALYDEPRSSRQIVTCGGG